MTSIRSNAARRAAAILGLAAGALHCSEPTGPGARTPAVAEIVAGNAQVGRAGDELPAPVAVRVTDAQGRPVAGTIVEWQVAAGGGSVTAVAERTDDQGLARARWRLGLVTPSQRAEARVAAIAPVAFTATASGRIDSVSLSLPADSVLVGDAATVALRVVDNFGVVRGDLVPAWTSSDASALAVSASGVVTARAEGAAEIRAVVEGQTGRLALRAVDVATALTLDVAAGASVDVEDTYALAARVTGRTGNVLARAVDWLCLGPDVIASCGAVLRPRLVPLPEPVSVSVVARAAGVADTAVIQVLEQPITGITLNAPPVPFETGSAGAPFTAPATIGDTLHVYVMAYDEVGSFRVRPNRPFRLQLANGDVASATLGPVVGQTRRIDVVGRATGSSLLTVSANGASASVVVAVRAPVTGCPASGPLTLDLALGEARTLKPGAAERTACLDFVQARDAGRAWLVLTDALPRLTSAEPQFAADILNMEGQALFWSATAPVPASYPTIRMHTRRDIAAGRVARVTDLAGGAEQRPARREGLLDSSARITRIGPGGARPAAPGEAKLQQAGTPVIAVGDTLYINGIDVSPELHTVDGGPPDRRFLVTFVSDRLVIAELLDVLTERLRYADGSPAPRIPEAVYLQLDEAYAVPRAQLDRLFPGTPVPTTIRAGLFDSRDMGARDLMLHVPLRPGFLGFAGSQFVLMDYWFFAGNTQPFTPQEFADDVMAHEFAHLRHISRYWASDAHLHPWLVEGLAVFSQELSAAARAFGTPDPPRTTRSATRPANGMRLFPSLYFGGISSHFRGYEYSAFVLDYLADHVSAAGGDWRAAVLDLVRSAGSAEQADAAIGARFAGLDAQDLVHRARVAATLEQLRIPGCQACLVPAAGMPDWTRFLQYDLPAISFAAPLDAPHWPVFRPGSGGGTAFTLRTGAMWPAFIDGRAAVGDETYLLDLSAAPDASVTVVRIR